MTATFPLIRPRRGLSLLCIIACLSCSVILAIWYGMNSDRDYIHPILTQLIPAGHCACQTSTTFQCSTCLSCPDAGLEIPSSPRWNFDYSRDARNEALDHRQCEAAFPGLFEDVARGQKYWRSLNGLVTEDLDAIQLQPGMARVFISRGHLHIVAARANGEDHRRKILGVLSSIHRALAADQDRVSRRDIEFVFSVEDKVEDVTNSENPVWVFARTATEEGVWLMPDFSFWAWDNPNNYIGPYDQVVDRIKRLDIPWDEKKPQLVWRGKPSFAPKLRRALMEAARNKPWGDVKQVEWSSGTNVLKMEDHCHYMFIAHVEGEIRDQQQHFSGGLQLTLFSQDDHTPHLSNTDKPVIRSSSHTNSSTSNTTTISSFPKDRTRTTSKSSVTLATWPTRSSHWSATPTRRSASRETASRPSVSAISHRQPKHAIGVRSLAATAACGTAR